MNFNSPWNFDQPLKTNEPALKHTNSLQSPKRQPMAQQMSKPVENTYANFNALGNDFRGYGSGGWNGNKNDLSSQPISPETRQNIPKLKGPDVNKNNKAEETHDPWASIQINDIPSTNTSNDPWNFSSANNNYGYDLGINKNPTPTASSNTMGTSSYGNSGSLFGNLGDPFSDIEKPTLNTNLGMGMGMGMNTNMNMNVNMGYSNPVGNTNMNQFSFGTAQQPTYPAQTNLTGGYGNDIGFMGTPATNTNNQFDFNLGSSQKDPKQQSNRNNCFDFDLI